MQFKCNCCGSVADVVQTGALGGGGCVEPSSPPTGWRTIWTVIEEADSDDGRASTSSGPVLHSCPDCNAQMTVDEHHEAELEAREVNMEARGLAPQPPAPPPLPEPDSVDIGVGTLVRPSSDDQAAVDALLKADCAEPLCTLPAAHEGKHDLIF